MSSIKLFIPALLASATATAAAPSQPSAAAEPTVLPIWFQEKAPRMTAASAEFSIHFSGYYDTRCPTRVRCVVPGEAHGFFWFSATGIKSRVLDLRLNNNPKSWKDTVRVGKYEFVLRSLEPRPAEPAERIDPNSYVAKVALRVHSKAAQ